MVDINNDCQIGHFSCEIFLRWVLSDKSSPAESHITHKCDRQLNPLPFSCLDRSRHFNSQMSLSTKRRGKEKKKKERKEIWRTDNEDNWDHFFLLRLMISSSFFFCYFIFFLLLHSNSNLLPRIRFYPLWK